jgi:hypothetical protein
VAQPGEGCGEKTNFVAGSSRRSPAKADAERVFERGLSPRNITQEDDLIISMMPALVKTFRSFGKMNSIPTASSFK